MDVKQAVEAYSYAILNNTPKTQDWYLQKLRVFSSWCDSQGLTLDTIKPHDVRRFLEHIRTTRSPRTGSLLSTYTIHGYAQVVKGFLLWCSKEDGFDSLISSNVSKRVEMPKVDIKVIETFTPEHINALFAACAKENTPMLQVRDRAILCVLLDTGIRASELCGLTVDHCYLEPYDAFIKVTGKGRKEREVGLGKQARTALHRYITRFRKAAKAEQHVFLSRVAGPLTVSGLDQIIARLGAWAHITGVRVSPHTFRHTFACQFLLNGGDVYMLSRLMGHTQVRVTEDYLQAVKQRQARQMSASVLDTLRGNR